MKVLNIEDDAVKHNNICRVLKANGVTETDWAKNLEDAVRMVEQNENGYELFITDMFYPKTPAGNEEESGMDFIRKMEEMNVRIPVIVCSSVRYRIPGSFGTLYYSEK